MLVDEKILDSREEIAKIDRQNVLGSVEGLSDQCLHGWEEANKVKIPKSYRDVDAIVMCGMGGSGLGARIIESVFGRNLRVPLIRVNDYKLPDFVSERSLVICSSYSGTTEETVANAKEAVQKKAKWMAIGTGNTLIDIAKKEGVPFYQIVAKYNPSNQPRMAIGYSVMGQIALAANCGLLNISGSEVKNIAEGMKKISQSEAKKLALSLVNKIVCLISAEHLVGAMHTFSNQLNENSKVFTADYTIPELNHHLMEGFKHPVLNKKALAVIFADSDKYSERVRERFGVTKDVVFKNGVENYSIKISGESFLSESFNLIQLGAYVNIYLSVLYKQNPAPIPWVDYFKEKLGQPLGK